MATKFILAKYAPDLSRMEPRNIGVFVWLKGTLRARFLPDSAAEEFINDIKVYQRWISFWNRKISGETIAPTRGRPICVKDEKCLDALVSTQKGNYLLVDSGELLSNVKKNEIDKVVDYLFNDLVSPTDSHPSKKDRSFSTQCTKVLGDAGVKFTKRKPIECAWRGVKRHLHPDYYVGNGTPHGIFQRASLSSEQSVNAAALTMHTLLDLSIVEERQCRFLIRSQDVINETAEEGLKLFQKMCQIVDVESEEAIDQLAEFSTDSVG